MIRRTRIACRTTALVSVILLMMLALAASTTADTASYQAVSVVSPDAPPAPLINHQGYLLNPATGGPVPDASYNATFALYTTEVGGSAIWSENQQIVTSKGLFSVTLGTVNPIDPGLLDGYARWLSVSIDPDGELLPRIRVTHSPYAIYSDWAGAATNAHAAEVANLAADSERLGGNLPAAFAAAVHNHDATNIVSGKLDADRYHAIEDLDAEGYLGNAAGDLAVNNGVLQSKLNAEMLNGTFASGFAAAAHSHKGTDIVDGTIATVDLADSSVTSVKIADAAVAAADLANASITTAKIADGAVTSAKLASGVAPKFFTLDLYGAFVDGATFEKGWGPNAGMRLPDSGTPDFSFSFVIPPDYTSGTDITVRFIWHTPATSCGIELRPNYISIARAGRTHIAGSGASDGLTMVGGTVLSAPATANQSSAKDVRINTPVSGTNLVAGDAIIFGLFRGATFTTDTCANYLAIQGVSVSYQ